MSLAPMLTLLLVAAPVGSAPLGDIVRPVGSNARFEADASPIWGQYRVQVESADPALPAAIQAVRHPAIRSANAIARGDGSLVALFELDSKVRGVETSLDAPGRLRLRLWGVSGGAADATLSELLAEAVRDRPRAAESDALGFMPLGEGSPWSFVTFPLHAPPVDIFIPVAEDAVAASSASVPTLAATADLWPGLELRKTAAVDGGAWWAETADSFVLVASTLSDDATHEGALALAGEAYYLSGGNDEALEYFDRVLAAFPGSPRTGWYLFGRGLASQGMGRHARALEDFEAAARQLPSGEWGQVLAGLTASLAALDRWDEAFELSRSLRRGWPRMHLDPWLEAELAYRAEDPRIATQLLDALQEVDDPRRPLVLLRLSDCAWLSGDKEAFLYWLSSARATGDRSADIMVRLRRLEYQVMGDEQVSYPKALAELRSLAAIEPLAGLEVALAEGRYLHDTDMLLDACRMDRDTLRSYPDFPAAIRVEARMCRAAAVLMEIAHESGDSLFEAGVYLDFVDRRQAAACNDPQLVQRGADVLESLGLWEEARRSLSVLMVLEQVPPADRDQVVLRLGRLYLEAGRIADGLKSVEYFRDSRASRDLDVSADLLEIELVLVRGGEGDSKEARRLTRALLEKKLMPAQEREAQRLNGRAALALAQWKAAAASLERAHAIGPADDDANHDGVLLGWALVRCGRAADAAVALERVAPERLETRARAAYAYVSALAYRDLGRDGEAEALLADSSLVGTDNTWSDMSNQELEEIAWEHRLEELISVPSLVPPSR